MNIKKKDLTLTNLDFNNLKNNFNSSNFKISKGSNIKIGDLCMINDKINKQSYIDFCKKIVSMEELGIKDNLDDVFIGVFGTCIGIKNVQKIKVV